MQSRVEYQTVRCNFGDLQAHLNKYALEEWRVLHLSHGTQDERMVYVVMERPLKEHPKGGF